MIKVSQNWEQSTQTDEKQRPGGQGLATSDEKQRGGVTFSLLLLFLGDALTAFFFCCPNPTKKMLCKSVNIVFFRRNGQQKEKPRPTFYFRLTFFSWSFYVIQGSFSCSSVICTPFHYQSKVIYVYTP